MIKLTVSDVALALVLGMLPLLILPTLPDYRVQIVVLLASLLLMFMSKFYWRLSKQLMFIAIFLVGFIWATINGTVMLGQIEQYSGTKVQVLGEVESLYLEGNNQQRIVFRAHKINQRWVFPPLSISIKWDDALPYCAGQRWFLTLSLRPVHSQLNQGGFDGQRWAIANRRPLNGSLLSAQPLTSDCGWRQQLVSEAQRQLADNDFAGVLLALGFGESALIPQQTRIMLQQTGIAHLMAISGLHITIAALFGWLLVRGIQFFMPQDWISYRIPLAVSWMVALLYVWLAGSNPPAIRAMLALSFWIVLRLNGILFHAWQVWLGCITLILLADPLNVLSDSFWLSCFAVGSLIFWFQWCPLPQRFNQGWKWAWLRWGHLQLGMMLLLMPMQIGLFQGVSLNSLPANLWAVPLVSFIVVPLVLIALLLISFPLLSGCMWFIADRLLVFIFWPMPLLQQGWTNFGERWLAMSLIGWMGVVIWRFRWWHSNPISVCSMSVVITLWMFKSDKEQWRLDMLDIGHGLAVLIVKNDKAIIYDTGNRWPQGSSAERTVIPYLRWRGITVEQIIISHDHADHGGGLPEMQSAFPLASVRTPWAESGHLPCQQGNQWHWQGLDFTVLWPENAANNAGNNESCVIRVTDGQFSVLLTGDIEQKAELALVRQLRGELAADILQVPHHGSSTSSSPPFLRAVRPELSLASASRYNAWRLPSKKIVSRYAENNANWRDTSRSGQLSVFFFGNYWQIKGFREQLMPRWYHQRFGVRGDNA
nr:ComEC family protein [Edaphovirga cremea]